MKTLLILVTVLAATADKPRENHGGDRAWGYGDTNGPDTWPDSFPTCGGSRQSPVAIVTEEARPVIPLEPFLFTNYELLPSSMNVTNTGHTAQVEIVDKASVSGGDLPGTYTFAQFHFHWGAVDTRGSEHTIDGNRFSGELHLVHYLERYGNISEALQHPQGVAVLSVMLELSAKDNPVFESISDGLEEITHPGESACISPVPLISFLPCNTYDFYRYEGSLTTPECNEVVVWTLFKDTVSISSEQLEEFRELMSEEGHPLQDNFRNLQPLNGRQVTISWE